MAAAALDRLPGQRERAAAKQYGLGHGIGLDAEETPLVRLGEEAVVPDRATLALHVVLHAGEGRGAIAGQTVAVGPTGSTVLTGGVDELVECSGS